MKVINFFAGPGAGKSTTAAGLFYRMKLRGLRVELVTEYAREMVYENNASVLRNELALLGEQDQRQRRLEDAVDFAITDSPLLLTPLYTTGVYSGQWFLNAAAAVFNTYDNINFFVHAVKPYQQYGRTQTEAEARSLDGRLRSVLARCSDTPVIGIMGDDNAPADAFNHVRRICNLSI